MKYVIALVLAIVSTNVLAGGMKPWKKDAPNQACWCTNTRTASCGSWMVKPTQCFTLTEQKFTQMSRSLKRGECTFDKTTICIDPTN